MSWALWVGGAAGVLALILGLVWFLSAAALRHLRRRMRRATLRAMRRFRVRLNRWKLSPKNEIRDELMKDAVIIEAIVEHARENGTKLAEAEARAELYIDEIVPSFQIFSYYVFFANVVRWVLSPVYRIDIDEEDAKRFTHAFHRENAVIYVANHRSNADYMLLSHVLTERVALSYACGEWARVWPLESLFKSFGAYFVRRGFREKLYHTVLRRYVQQVTMQGVTQGVFIEGGLSRDGYLRPPKIGMIDYLTQVLRDEDFNKKDVLFVPVGINYDRVLEDRPLTNEFLRRRRHERDPELAAREKAAERKARPGRWGRRRAMLRRTGKILFKNLHKYWKRSIKKNGRAAVRFGDPVSFKDWCASQEQDIVQLERKRRLPEIARFADELLRTIGAVIPATAVSIVCRVIVEADVTTPISEAELEAGVDGVFERLRTAQAHFSPEDLDAVAALRRGRDLLDLRHLLQRDGEQITILERDQIIIRYYANSIDQLLMCQTAEAQT